MKITVTPRPVFSNQEQRVLDAFVDGHMDARSVAPKLFPLSGNPRDLLSEHMVHIRRKIRRRALKIRIEARGKSGYYKPFGGMSAVHMTCKDEPRSTRHIYGRRGKRTFMTAEARAIKEGYGWEAKSQWPFPP